MFFLGHVLLTTYVWSTDQLLLRNQKSSYFKFSLDFENTCSHAKIKAGIVACYLFERNQTNMFFGAEAYALIQSNFVNGGLEVLWNNLLWANSRLGSLKILLHALKSFCFLVIGFSAPALALFAKPCCWELPNWLLRPRHTIALTGVFGSLFQRLLRPWCNEPRSETEAGRLGARCRERLLLHCLTQQKYFQRVLVGPAGIPWRIGCKACGSATW